MQDTPNILGFTSGELSPWLSCRFDLQAYQRGAALVRNFMVQPYGGVRRRLGSLYVADAASQSEAVRLFSFRYSETDVMMLEFYPGGVRFYKDGACLMVDGEPYTVSAPWQTEEEMLSLYCVQMNDIVYITSPYFQPMALRRYGYTNWNLRTLDFKPFPRETYVAQDSPLLVHIYGDGTARLETSKDMFTPDMVGKEYVLAETETPSKTLFLNRKITFTCSAMPNLRTSGAGYGTVYYETDSVTSFCEFYTCIRTYTADDYNGNASASYYRHFFLPGAMLLNGGKPYEVSGDWEIRTHGEWDANWEVWRSYDTYQDNVDFYQWQWTCIKTFGQSSYSTRKNWEITGSEKLPCRMVLVCRSAKTSVVGTMLYMSIRAGKREYKFRIVQYTHARRALALNISSYIDPVGNFSTYRWSFGAFGPRNGYPRIIGFHQGRLWLGGISGLPTTLIASAIGDFYNFGLGSDDDAALHLTLATSDQSIICWICPSRNLLVGTTDSEWILSAPDGGAIKATNASFTRQSSVGSEDKPAYGVENTVFYVQRGGKRLREISYKLESDGFTSTDMSLLAEHLFGAGIREWAVQRGGSTRLWVLMNDNTLAVLTMNIEQNVAAWQRVSFNGRRVLHLATLPKVGSHEDEVWFVIHNPVGGRYTLERISSDSFHLDGACTGPLAAAPHLAGLSGYAYPQGSPEQAVPVSFDGAGGFSVPDPGLSEVWCYGAAYDSELETLPLEREFSFNTVRQEGRVRLRLLESSPAFSYRASHVGRWETYDPARDHLPPVYTGSVRLSHIPSPGVGQGFSVKVEGTLDFQLLALSVEIDYHGR